MNLSTYVSLIFLAVLYFSAISLSKYGNKYYWFFETAHFLGGFFVAMFVSSFVVSPVIVFGGVVAVGILWELVELIINRSDKIQKFLIKNFNHYVAKVTWPDTLLDLVLDFSGAIVYLYFFKWIPNEVALTGSGVKVIINAVV